MGFADEIKGQRAPEYLQNFTARIGGKTPGGDPLYRVVRAESVFHKSFQEFTDWDESIEGSERGGTVMDEGGQWHERTGGRIRTVEEMREIEAYPNLEGWIVERWYPADMLLWTRQEWEKRPILGPFPERGRYVNVNTRPIRSVPTIHQVEGLINATEYKICNKKGTVESRIKENEARILKALADKKKAERERNQSMMREVTRGIWGSSLAAGRVREVLANRMRARGIKIGHVGN